MRALEEVCVLVGQKVVDIESLIGVDPKERLNQVLTLFGDIIMDVLELALANFLE